MYYTASRVYDNYLHIQTLGTAENACIDEKKCIQEKDGNTKTKVADAE